MPAIVSSPDDPEAIVSGTLTMRRSQQRRLENLATIALINPAELLNAGADLYALYLTGNLCLIDETGLPAPITFEQLPNSPPSLKPNPDDPDAEVIITFRLKRRQQRRIENLATLAMIGPDQLLFEGAQLYAYYLSDRLRIKGEPGQLGRLTLSWTSLEAVPPSSTRAL